jgi:hypothetical protein
MSDSLITMRRSKFFVDLASRSLAMSALQANYPERYLSISPSLREYNVEYVPSEKGLYLHLGRTGRLYEMQDRGDSLLYFVRLDKTVNINYNIGSFIFCSKGSVYELGGYGFWKSNGLLRRYNPQDREWDIVPTNREMHINMTANWRDGAWLDSSQAFLYVPFQKVINDGLIASNNSNFVLSQDFYRLAIKQRVWEKLGRTTDEAMEIFLSANWTSFPSNRGYFLGFTKGVYHFDFIDNQISFNPNPVLVQSLMRLQSNSHCYYYKGWVYAFNPTNYKYDSIRFDLKQFAPTGQIIWEKPFPYATAGIALGVLLMGGGFLFYRHRRTKRVAQAFTPAQGQVLSQPFSELEKALLSLLLTRFDQGRTSTISDINYVLGVKDKSPGMQKKVRSDILNGLNKKFAFVSQKKEPLVQSVRSEDDKRYFEYFINPACQETVLKLLT